MPARGDVGLAAGFVQPDERRRIDGDGRIVDDAGIRHALDVVDVHLVHRPRIDLALRSVDGVVDRAVVEAERLGDAVWIACGEPGVLRSGLGLRAGTLDERIDGGLHVARTIDGLLVGEVDLVGVTSDDCGPVGGQRRWTVVAGRAREVEESEREKKPAGMHGE